MSSSELLKSVGPIKYIRSSRAKYLRISIDPVGTLRVTMPGGLSQKKADEFILKKIEWIKKHKKKYSNRVTLFTEKSIYKTRDHRLVITRGNIKNPLCRIKSGEIIVKFPADEDILDDKNQALIRESIIKAYRKEAKEYIPQRVEYFAGKYKLSYNNITIKNVKTRWGSCSSKNNLNFNLHLMRLPDHLIDYVILHELAHTIEKNHGKRFWLLLDKLTGNARVLDKELKNYRSQLW